MDEHYFTANPSAPDRRFPLPVRLAGRDLELVSSSAVFSGHGLDKATAVLLDRLDEVAEPPEGGTLVDLGCGWGPIALTAALLHPGVEVWAVDVSERARELTAENARRAGVENLRVLAPEEIPGDLAVDTLWSNPPIRIGKAALHDLLGTWLARLAPGGRALLVVQKHLGADSLAKWMDGHGWSTQRLLSRRGFRILEVRARAAAATD